MPSSARTSRLFASIILVSEAVGYTSATSQRSACTVRGKRLIKINKINKYANTHAKTLYVAKASVELDYIFMNKSGDTCCEKWKYIVLSVNAIKFSTTLLFIRLGTFKLKKRNFIFYYLICLSQRCHNATVSNRLQIYIKMSQ